MGCRCGDKETMGRTLTAAELVKERAHTYRVNKYLQVHVFTRLPAEYNTLMREFGGHVYKHGSGWTWVVTKRTELQMLCKKMRGLGLLPSNHNFEVLIEKHYMED